MRTIIAVTFLAGVLACTCLGDNGSVTDSFPTLEGAYLGQESQGAEPTLFAPGIIPTDGIEHCFPTFAPDGKEVYWMIINREARRGEIMCMREENGRWTPPQVASFSGEQNDHSPFFAPDGKRLYFSSSRPGGYGKADIWYVEKTDSGWSEAKNLGSPPNSEESESQPTFTGDGTLYFVSSMDSVQWDRGIYRSRLVDGKYQKREALGSMINTEYCDAYPFIANDESYLLFCSCRPGGNSKETDLYISFRNSDGTFGQPQNLGAKINNGKSVSFPYVTADGKYLFFERFIESGTDAFFWMDADIIDQFAPGK